MLCLPHCAGTLLLLLALAPATPRAEAPNAADAPALSERELRGLELSREPAASFDPWLASPVSTDRVAASRALGLLRDEAAVPRLEAALADPVPAVRSAAAFGLGHYPETAPTLLSALATEGEPAVRIALLDALGRSGDASVVSALLEGLKAQAQEAITASHALGRLGVRGELGAPEPALVEALLGELKRLDPQRRRAAAFALARTKLEAQPPELADRLLVAVQQQADPTARAWLVRAASTALDARRWDLAVSSARDDAAVGVRVALARGLATRGDAAASAAMPPLLADEDRSVRIAALDACARLSWDPSWEEPLQALLGLRDHEQQARALPLLASAGALAEAEGWLNPTVDPSIRAAMLAIVDDPAELARLAVEDRAPPVRTAATELLLQRSPPPDRALMLPLIQQPDAVVAGLVASALAEEPDGELEDVLLAQLIERIDYDGLLAMLEALIAIQESAPDRGPGPHPLPGSLKAQALIRVADLRNHQDLALRSAARRVGEAWGMPPANPAPFPRMGSADELDTLLGARVRTSRGELVIRFETEAAPYTVQRWVERAEDGFYDGLAFHRVVPDFVVQGGCPRGDGYGGPGYVIPDEHGPLPYHAGAVGMATAGPDTGGSQWFITLSPQPHLDGDYTLFAYLVQGEDVLRRLRQDDRVEGVLIERRLEASTTSPP